MENTRKHWGVDQWAAFFATRPLPVMPRSKTRVAELAEAQGDALSPHALAEVVLDDPLLCLRLLREAEHIRSQRLGNETTTTLQAIMQLGIDRFRRLLDSSEEIDNDNAGLLYVKARSALASRIALRWAPGRSDMRPVELALAALLADTGELLLWLHAPQLAQAALDELRSGRAARSSQAQIQVCGFDFKSLTLRCAEAWHLPDLLIHLLRGQESERALIARTCNNFARHLLNNDENTELAMAADLVDAHKLLPAVSYEWLTEGIPELDAETRQHLIDRAHKLHTYEI